MLLGGVEKILDNGTRIRGYMSLKAFTSTIVIVLQCFDCVGWAAGRAYGV